MVVARRRTRSAAAALIVASCVGASSFVGCSEVLGIDSSRYVVDASDEQADSGPPPWWCIGGPVPPTPDHSVEYEMFVSDVSGMQTSGSFEGTPIAGVQVQACDRLDFSCVKPIDHATTSDGGIALMTLPGGFNGYYTMVANGYVSSLVQRPAQLESESDQNAMVSAGTLSLGEQVVNVNQDPKNAVAIVSLLDCNSVPALGATFELSDPAPGELMVYLQDRIPTRNATSTDVTGSVMFFNVPAGSMTVTAYMPDHRQVGGSMTALTRAGWVTFIQMRPDQATVVHP